MIKVDYLIKKVFIKNGGQLLIFNILKKLCQKIINLFNNQKIINKNVNGELTQGENMAGLGGLLIAYQAFNLKRTDKDKRRFFISFASNWKSKTTKQAQLLKLITDPHALKNFV